MTIEEILAGESKNVEFKESLPEKSIKYMKSVVAFANGIGGKIILGIADKTREVVGFSKEDVFEKMDAIANAVSDSCEPAIIPDISLQTIDGKTVIVVEISEGRQRPYYIKALGRDGGVYVRVAGTTRLADEYMIKELLFEGSNRYYDQALCTGLNITDEDIDALCKAMKEQAIKNAHTEEQKASIKDVGRQQLRSWGVLIERDGKDYPSNAFAILTGNAGLHVATQCGVFKGTTKAVFVDRREYTGPLWEQIDEAFQFVLRNIHLGATIVGIYRQDVYEIPPDAIRELIINAMVHRSYLDHGTIQVAVYDNRLEITSPGKLPDCGSRSLLAARLIYVLISIVDRLKPRIIMTLLMPIKCQILRGKCRIVPMECRILLKKYRIVRKKCRIRWRNCRIMSRSSRFLNMY